MSVAVIREKRKMMKRTKKKALPKKEVQMQVGGPTRSTHDSLRL